MRCGDTTIWFAGVLSAGLDAVVNERANRMRRPRGKSRYTLAMLLVLTTFRPISYRLTVDGRPRRMRAMLISVANNVSIGGGMRVVPGAVIDDGLLDLFIVAPLSRAGFLRVFPKVFSGTHATLPQVEITRCRSIRIDANWSPPTPTGRGSGQCRCRSTWYPKPCSCTPEPLSLVLAIGVWHIR